MAVGRWIKTAWINCAAHGGNLRDAPRATRVVEAHHRRAVLHGEIHHLADLLGVRFGERAAEDGEVLREDIPEPPFDAAPTGHDAVTEHLLIGETEIGGAMRDEAIELDEGPRIEEHVEPLARGHFPFLMLCRDTIGAAPLL